MAEDASPALTPDAVAAIAAEDATAARADAAERVKTQASIADAMMKALLWANGGAMVALFTFIGNVVGKADRHVPLDGRSLWLAFAAFVVGLVAALFCHFAAFASQDRLYNVAVRESWRHQSASIRQTQTTPSGIELRLLRQGMIAYAVGLGMALISTAMFAIGCGLALYGVLLV